MNVPYALLLDTVYGKLLVNRCDLNQTQALLMSGEAFDYAQIGTAMKFCEFAPPGSVMLDIGANFGVYSLACAKVLQQKNGVIHAYEGQRVLSYMIAGSMVLNSVENVFVHNACVGNSTEPVPLPRFAYDQPMNFGSIEFGGDQKEPLDQARQASTEVVRQIRIDDQGLQNVYLAKIDVEGMELAVLEGAKRTLTESRPIVQIEFLKSAPELLADFFLSRNYAVYFWDGDFLCVPKDKDIHGINLPVYTPGMMLPSSW